MTRRPGLSLTEVLVALFLMAIGVIGVLTMFPVGAVQMGLALKDQRCAEAATQADAYIRWYWQHNIVEPEKRTPNSNTEPLWTSLNGGTSTAPIDDNPSPPVFVDPMGIVAGRASTVTGTTIARVNLNQIGSPSQALRTCTLLDGFTYDQTGIPMLTGTSVDRENRYNWLWVIQRPRNRDKFTVNMSIVVFDKRAHLYIPPNAEQSRAAIPASPFATGSTSVKISPLPELQKGGWIMDASSTTTTNVPPATITLANFYRVASATTDNTATSIELQTPARAPLGGGSRSTNTAVHLGGVAEVFDRTQLTSKDTNAP